MIWVVLHFNSNELIYLFVLLLPSIKLNQFCTDEVALAQW